MRGSEISVHPFASQVFQYGKKAFEIYVRDKNHCRSGNSNISNPVLLHRKSHLQYITFLLRDSYSKHWYEPRLYKNLTEFEEPDYTLKPNFTFETDLSLLEVKLPNENFVTQSKFHTSPKSKLMRHIFQVNDYKDYLESNQYLEQINKTFGYIPKNINYNILIGRQKDKDENIYNIKKRMRQMGQNDLNLMTYDELLEYQVKFFERMKLLDVK